MARRTSGFKYRPAQAAEWLLASRDAGPQDFGSSREAVAFIALRPGDYASPVTSFESVKVAAVQATPVILDAEASIEKAGALLRECAGQGVQLAVLPEAF